MDKDKLRSLTRKALAESAKRKGVKGWHAMSKEQLIRALAPHRRLVAARAAGQRLSQKRAAAGQPAKTASRGADGRQSHPSTAKAAPRPYSAPIACSPERDISTPGLADAGRGASEDRITLSVLEPHWLCAGWQMSSLSVARAEAALGKEWHGAMPILRLVDVTSEDATGATETKVRDIEIYGGVTTWYLDVKEPGRSYRVDIGYLSRKGRFFALARSNTVTPPRSVTSDRLDSPWTGMPQLPGKANGGASRLRSSGAKLRKLFAGPLRVPMKNAGLVDNGGRPPEGGARPFAFDLDAELIVYGATAPDAAVTLQGQPVDLRKDGTFTLRYSLPEGRQIIPAVATSRDGTQELTVILAVERNTKRLEPVGMPTELEAAE